MIMAEDHAEKLRRARADRSLQETEKRINASRDAYNTETVSYTHLTLPTIYSV